MNSKITKTKMFVEVLNRGLLYHRVEVILVVLFGFGLYMGSIWVPLLWFGFVGSVLWVLATSLKAAERELFQGLLARELYITDFITGVVLFSLLAVLVRHEAPQFWIMYTVAAAQQMRYTLLSYKCLRDERKFNASEESNKDT